jgi:hypothetical protein
LARPYIPTASFSVVGFLLLSLLGSCVTAARPPIVGSCGATIGLIDVATLTTYRGLRMDLNYGVEKDGEG